MDPTRGFHVGDYARNIESHWLGRIEAFERRDGETYARMIGVDFMATDIVGMPWQESLSPDDTRWHAPADLVPASPRAGDPPAEQPEPDEPEEGDLITEDHITFYQHEERRGGPAFVVAPGEDWHEAAGRWMRENRFYPSVWWLGDHGDAQRMNRPEGRETPEDRTEGGPAR